MGSDRSRGTFSPDDSFRTPNLGMRVGWWVAASTATISLFVAGAGYRAVSPSLSAVRGDATAPQGLLRTLPNVIDGWSGRDIPLDERVIRATDTDDHLNRVYARDRGGDGVALYIAFGIRLRDLAPHRPEVCYPGSGWTMEDQRKITFNGADGIVREAQVHRFRRGLLDFERIEVLSYYIIGGVHFANVGALRTAWWRTSEGPAYSAQVQIVATVDPYGTPTTAGVDFAQASAGPIAQVLAGVAPSPDP